MNPKVVVNKDGAKPQGQVVSNMNFFTVFSLSLLFIASFFERGNEYRCFKSVAPELVWRRRGQRRGQPMGRNVIARGFVKGRCWTHQDKKKKPRRLFVLETRIIFVPPAALILGARDRQMVFKCRGLFSLSKWIGKNPLHVVKSWISKKINVPLQLSRQRKELEAVREQLGPKPDGTKKSGQGGGRVADGRWFQ